MSTQLTAQGWRSGRTANTIASECSHASHVIERQSKPVAMSSTAAAVGETNFDRLAAWRTGARCDFSRPAYAPQSPPFVVFAELASR